MADTRSMSLDRPPSYVTIDTPSVQVGDAPDGQSLYTSQASVIRELEVHKPGSASTNGLLIKHNGNALYYTSHYVAQDQPDIILHGGYDVHGPRLAQVQFIRHSKDFKIYVGDHKTPTKDDWDMVRESGGGFFKEPQYRFEVRYNVTEAQRIKRRFYWQKTHESDLGASKFSRQDFKLVDEATDAVVAIHLVKHKGPGEHRGTIKLYENLPEYPQVATLMGLLAIFEKSRRYKKAVANAFPNTNGW